MFYSKKWLTNDGRLREPWIQGTFGQNIPQYVNINRNQNISHTCCDILEVVRSKSKKMKHRISLKLSAELSCGTCYMYKNRVDNFFEDCYGNGTITKSLCRKPLSLTDSTASVVSSDSSSRDDAAVYRSHQSSDTQEVLADMVVRKLKRSHEFEEDSEGEIIVSEDNTLPMDISPENNPTMLLPENLETEATGDVNVFEEPTQLAVEKPSNMYEIIDDDFAIDDQGTIVTEERTSQAQKHDEKQSKDLEDTSNGHENIDEQMEVDFGKSQLLRMADISHPRNDPLDKSSVAEECVLDITPRKTILNDIPDVRDDDCLQEKQTEHEDNVEGEKSDVSDKLLCADTSVTSDVSLGTNDEDVAEIQSTKELSIFKPRVLYDITEEETVIEKKSSLESLLYIDMSSEITQINQNPNPPKDSNINTPSEDRETLPNHSDVRMEHDTSTDGQKNRSNTDIDGIDGATSTHSVHSTVNVIFPMYLRGSINPDDIRVKTGPIFKHNELRIKINSDVESTSSVFRMDIKRAIGVEHCQPDLLDKEWGEVAVYTKLVVLWRHIRLVPPEKLFGQGWHCRNMAMARTRMFHSLLCLKSKDLVRCVKDVGGQIKYITKGKHLLKLNPLSLSD